ncbi:DNA-directed RNA polymerase III subunit RPC3 isoform X4 [Prunus yedoensis var. nudiflora]|uniref:DNA-directed RNA polymerase III subunit RPC3 n=1 Tax=Prunus yedoensis var. nudiflora TaxID=2094558 RepID=A0A314UX53_PRUYE|nr:DNA-directed RNA polymerase III subunit RPC3 isoform X4 [Prunus yedoensis var. nudiflora]
MRSRQKKMTPNQYGIKYAVHIVTSNFGNLVFKCVKSTKKRTFKPETANWVHRADPSASPELSPYSDPTQLRGHPFSDYCLSFIVLQCELILKDLLENGRLTLKQIMEGAESSKRQGDSAGEDSVQESFLKLVNAHFVESCPLQNQFLNKLLNKKMVEVPETIEQLVPAAAAPRKV